MKNLIEMLEESQLFKQALEIASTDEERSKIREVTHSFLRRVSPFLDSMNQASKEQKLKDELLTSLEKAATQK